jgi:hypothetical protein
MSRGDLRKLSEVGDQSARTKSSVVTRDGLPPEDALRSISLVSGNEIDSINRAINKDFSRMVAELRHAPEQVLNARLRRYDGYQRMTFGRALTGIMAGHAVLHGLAETDFNQCPHNGKTDHSFFPQPFTRHNYAGLWAAVHYSVRMLFNSPMQSDSVLVTVFCHRVLIRPGETYNGFMHRDLSPEGRIGTVIWYPRVDANKITGAELFSYNVEQGVTLEELAGRQADNVYPPSAYRGKVMFLAYPENYPHGVRPGHNRTLPDDNRAAGPKDFLQPKSPFFVKDIFILSISERSPVED